jgi:chromosome segregation ATPase
VDEYDETADELEQEADRLEQESADVERQIHEQREDWDSKAKSESVPGAQPVPEPGAEPPPDYDPDDSESAGDVEVEETEDRP